MAASSIVTLLGSDSQPNGLLYDGKKTLTITKDYGSNVVTLSGSWNGLKDTGKGSNSTINVAGSKLGIVSVSADVTNAVSIVGGSAALMAYLNSKGGTLVGGNGSDKFYGNSGKDVFVVGKGDVIGDGKTADYGYGAGDKIVFADASVSTLGFTDNYGKNSVVITNGKDKVTVYKSNATTPLTIEGGKDGQTLVYGVDGTKTSVTNNNKTLTINSDKSIKNGDVFDASTIAAGLKIIDGTAITNKAIFLVGNEQADNISIGAGGGTISGGSKKASNDNLYGTTGGNVTFLIGANGGNDNIFGYKEGDTIKIADSSVSTLNFATALKDGGAGKDISVTYKSGSKLVIKSNTANRIVFDINGKYQAYGPSLSAGLSVDTKTKTSLIVGADFKGDSVAIDGWTNGLSGSNAVVDNNALKTFAPKLNTINASSATTKVALHAQATVGTILQSGAEGSTMIGGTGADQYTGGTGEDVYVVDVSKSVNKDVINTYGAGDIIVLTGLSTVNSVSLDSKGVVYFKDDKTDQKNNNITIKNFKTTTLDAPVVVVDGDTNEVLAVRASAGIPGPAGLDVTNKGGLVTNENFEGTYDGVPVKGATLLENGSYNTEAFDNAEVKVLDANDYGGAVKAINASVVSGNIGDLEIIGNANVKNTIYLPNLVERPSRSGLGNLNVTVKGGAQNDTFIGHSTATKTTVYYHMSGGGKDVIEGFNAGEGGDYIVLDDVASLSTAGDSRYINDSQITEKGTDVIFTYKNNTKNTLTIKNAAGKLLQFRVGDEDLYYGYTLDEGLSYDTKKTAINASADWEGGKIDLNKNTVNEDGDYYYAGIKTVSLAAATEAYARVIGNSTVANEIYAPQNGSFLYGGDPKGAKPSVDKLYGGSGADVFAHRVGAGADVVGNTKTTNTLFDSEDALLLGSNSTVSLEPSDLTFTDKKTVLTITYSDKTKFTVNKATSMTPVKIYFTDSVVSSWDGGDAYADTDSGALHGLTNVTVRNQDYFVYGIDDRKFQTNTSSTDFEKGTLAISGAGILGYYSSVSGSGRNSQTVIENIFNTIGSMNVDGSTEEKNFAVVDVKYVSSGIKNVRVDNDNLVVSLTGGANALNVTMGAAGGTVSGGVGANDKALNDKFTSNGNTVFVLDKTTGGKDVINNYNADKGDVLYFKDGKPNSVKFSAKSIVFAYDGNKSTFTIYPPSGTTFTAATNVKIAFPVVSNNETVISSETYFGWDAKTTQFSAYENSVRDDQWTKPADNVYVFYGKNTGEKFGFYGTNYTLQGASIVDANNDYIPDKVAIGDENGSISFDNDNATDTYIDPIISGFHITGTAQYNNGANMGTKYAYVAGDAFYMNGVTYTLADVDGNTVNGFELSKDGWVKTADDAYVHFNYDFIDVENSGKASVGSSFALFTVTGAVSDGASVGENNDVLSKFAFSYDGSASDLTIAVADNSVEISGSHVKFSDAINNGNTGEKKFDASNRFTITTKVGSNAAEAGEQVGTYKLYDGDGDTVNGFELLRTDIASSKNWTLLTPSESNDATLQTNGTGVWQYDDSKEDDADTDTPLKFSIGAGAGMVATLDGTPVGVQVGTVDADGGEINDKTIYFSNPEFNTANVIFDTDTKIGSDTGAVHISGLAVGTQFTIGSGESAKTYVTAEFDGDSSNGYELLEKNTTTGWTYNAGAWIYDNTGLQSSGENSIPALNFTISAAASLQAWDDGTPKNVTVVADTESGKATIDFSGMSDAQIVGSYESTDLTGRSDTSLITFGNITTGDVLKTVRIKGFDSETAVFNINGNSYLADLDSDTANGYELLPYNSNWRRTDTGWNYYAGTAPTNSNSEDAPTLIINTLQDSDNRLISADINGAPKGITISDNQFTINESFGTIAGKDANGEDASSGVVLTPAMLEFASNTAINYEGIHILGNGTKSSVTFGAGAAIKVLGEDDDNTNAKTYKLANLDRNITNGYELLTTVAGWTFNNGDEEGYALGSWTFESDVKVGDSDAIKFTVSESASLFAVDTKPEDSADTIVAGNPEGIYVSIGEGQATLYSDAVQSTQLIFADTDTTMALFQSSTGLHVVGFEEDDLVTVVATPAKTNNGKVTKPAVIWSYRVKELSGDTVNGSELLKVSDGDRWSLTANEDTGYNREWTYKDDYLTLNAGYTFTDDEGATQDEVSGGLYASANGNPINLSVTTDTTASTPSIINVNQDSDAARLQASSLFISTSQVGSGTSVHIVGYDSDTTLSVNDGTTIRPYRLTDLDGIHTNGLELVAYNENWTYYATDAKLTDIVSDTEGGVDYKAGTWMYSKTFVDGDDEQTFYMALDSDVALRTTLSGGKYKLVDAGGHKGMAAADENGAPIGATVSGNSFSGLTLTFDSNRLNIQTVTGTGKTFVTSTTVFDHITLGSNTAINKEGTHIIGFDSGTTLNLGGKQFYLADLDSNTDNGFELIAKHDQWARTADGWTYDTDTVKFALNTVLETHDNGAPIGISVVSGINNGTDSDTIVIDRDLVSNASLIALDKKVVATGENGIHISLVGEAALDNTAWDLTAGDVTFKIGDKNYLLKELDGNSNDGYELLLANDEGWSLTNGGADSDTRIWTYTGTNTKNANLTFTINPKTEDMVDGYDSDQGLHADSDGLPVGVSVELDSVGTKANAIYSYRIDFGDTDTGDTEITTGGVSYKQVTFDTVVTGVNGIHIKGLVESDTLAYSSDTDCMFNVDGVNYYLAKINTAKTKNSDFNDYYELLADDENWHRNENDWSYDWSYTTDTVAFKVGSFKVGSSEVLLGASTVEADQGKPAGISVIHDFAKDNDEFESTFINVTSSVKIADAIIFDSETKVAHLHISLSTANAMVTTFAFRPSDMTSTESDTTYYIVNADHNATNGAEFYMMDTDSDQGIWKRTTTGWDYFSSVEGATNYKEKTSKAFAFRINISDSKQNGYNAEDAGSSVPADFTVDSDAKIITWSNTNFAISDFGLYSTTALSTSITVEDDELKFSSPHFHATGDDAANRLSEGATIGAYDASNKLVATYQLYNADGNAANGLELTYNGWNTVDSGGIVYSYVRGTDAELESNIGFVLKVSDDVLKPAITGAATLPGFRASAVTSTGFGFDTVSNNNSTSSTKGVVISQLTSKNFHVRRFEEYGNIYEGEVTLGNNTYKLKDVDSDTTNGYELISSDRNWAKLTADSGRQLAYVGTTGTAFTLAGGNANLDKNNDFIPDSAVTVTIAEGKTTVEFAASISGLQLQLAGATDSDTFVVKYTGKETLYTLTGGSSIDDYCFSFAESDTTTANADTNSQLPSDIDELLNYDSGAAFSSDLDSILDTGSIGVSENLNVFDASDPLTGVATNDKSINALLLNARHRARK